MFSLFFKKKKFNLISTQYNIVSKSVCFDNAPKLASHDFFIFFILCTKGVIPYHSCVAIPEQNSVIKCWSLRFLSFIGSKKFIT